MNILVFDLETIPDTYAGKLILDTPALSELDTSTAMQALRRQETGHTFLPHYLHRIVAISVVFKSSTAVKVWSLGEKESDEKELIQRFFDGIEKNKPTLVSWNGSGFDLPVLHYRALLHGIQAPRYWEVEDNGFKYNNYLNRYHYRHMDLMDILAAYQGRAVAPLDNIAKILGFPGKMGQSGAGVCEQYYAGEIQAIRDYCETDVLNTYLIYLRFELMRGKLSHSDYNQQTCFLKEYLTHQNKPHFTAFLEAWIEDAAR